MLIDTHCHLDAAEFDADRDAVRERAFAAGLAAIVVPAVEVANFGAVRALAAADRRIGYALGIHPMYVGRAGERDLALLRQAIEASLGDPAFLAIGEVGLDFFEPGLDRVRQERYFRAQLELAREFGLPVLMHVRRSQDVILKHLRSVRPPGGIAHAFSGSLQQAGQFLGLGMVLGFGGAVTFDRASRLRRLVRELPAEAHVLETDAPDIPPAWIVRRRNEPAQLARIAQVFADVRGEPVGLVVQRTGANAGRAIPRLSALLARADRNL
ncbi:MAG: TatD family deoxyribonuclease [Lautropia sp.]|nr:MAG: TatD family deoxyribonuclease [Pseudomonadota bacterium]MBC6958255.1 TatD family deoxyribonuclease [Lautropia sp.]MCL4700810.1 TatD family hydrolase [Burkholderiaceae bacterium]MDL1906717.1 TatD family deoxyribonuclease [Betaproteobacteria bacterium PRO1]RIK89779.1 MAG: DNAase [Burkholderiales bacterium]